MYATSRGLLEAVNLHHVRVPLVRPLRSAAGEVRERSSVIVCVQRADGHQGWSECVALDGLGYPVASLQDSWAWLCGGPSMWWSATPQDSVTSRAASGALLDALLDAQLRADDVALADWLSGPSHARSVCSARVLSVENAMEPLVRHAGEALAAGHRHLVCKIQPGWDVSPLATLRREYPDVSLAADANGSYPHVHDVPADLDDLGLTWLEQPLPPEDLRGSAQLAAVADVPIVLDEGVLTAADLRAAIEAGALNGLNVKPGRTGGVARAHELALSAAASGLDVLVGGLLETGIGRGAAVALAASPVMTLPTDLGPSNQYLRRDFAGPFTMDGGGQIAVPVGAGLGVEPDRDVIAAHTVRRCQIAALS